MTDMELLEMAAKAAGLHVEFQGEFGDSGVNGWYPCGRDEGGNVLYWWNPLKGDGDALRLAVDLRIDVYPWISEEDPTSSAMARNSHGFRAIEFASNNGGCIYAATRRAIVRAAAEIGRAMP